MSLFRRPFSKRKTGSSTHSEDDTVTAVSDGVLNYVTEKSGNDAGITYQEATGAPVESTSPLGYFAGPISIIFLNINTMIGTGVFSTPSTVLSGTGSVGLAMIYWSLGFFASLSSLAMYLEYLSYFPNRSGSEVVYLEQAYPKPKYFFPTTFAFQSVVLSFSSGNAIVLAQYLWRINGATPTAWQLKGTAIAGYTVAVLIVIFHTRFSFYVSNSIGAVKVLTLLFISITGLVVLGGHTSVPDPHVNFQNSFEGTATPYGLTNALVKVLFSYSGFDTAFNVANEVKNPVKNIRNYAFFSLALVTTLFIFANIAYLAAVPKDELKAAQQIAASLFFTKVFGSSNVVRGLNFLIALSSFGSLLSTLIGTSRMIRECGRQGVLPFPKLWASTKPFGTPLVPYLVKYSVTILMILAPPAGDAFNLIVDLQSYPNALFTTAMAIGIFLVRWRRSRAKLPPPPFRAWDIAIIFNILVHGFLLVMPWYPPAGGPYAGNVSFLWSTYCIIGIGILVGCGIYYTLWVFVIPKFRGYQLRQIVIILENGAQAHQLVKVPNEELDKWDATHDAVGRENGQLSPVPPSDDGEMKEEKVSQA